MDDEGYDLRFPLGGEKILRLRAIKEAVQRRLFPTGKVACAHHQEVKLYYTASGIVTLCGWPSGAQVSQPAHRKATCRV